MTVDGVTIPPTALQRAITWLRTVLSNGPLPVKDIEARAADVGITRRTLKRARARLKVTSRPDGFGGARLLELPEGAATGCLDHSSDPVTPGVDPEKRGPDLGVDPPKVQTAQTPAPRVGPSRPRPAPERPSIRRVKLRRLVRQQPST